MLNIVSEFTAILVPLAPIVTSPATWNLPVTYSSPPTVWSLSTTKLFVLTCVVNLPPSAMISDSLSILPVAVILPFATTPPVASIASVVLSLYMVAVSNSADAEVILPFVLISPPTTSEPFPVILPETLRTSCMSTGPDK